MEMVGYIRFAALASYGLSYFGFRSKKKKKSPEESNGRRFKSI